MTNRIELPGGLSVSEPSQETQMLLNQLQQVTVGINTLCGQTDLLIRLTCGQMSKHEVKVKYEANDAKIRTEIAAQQAASSE